MTEMQTEAVKETSPDLPEPKGRWCLVANVTSEYANAARPPGSRHLPEGARVYVNRAFCGDGWTSTEILSKDRRSQKWFKMYLAVHWLHNFRAVVEYSPSMQKRLDEENFVDWEDVCRWYAEEGNQRAADFAIGRITRRHAPPVEPAEKHDAQL